MRRIVIIGTALVVLVIAASAYAAFNTYTEVHTFSSNKAGSANSPVPVGFNENYTASGTAGNRTAPLTDVKTKIYGLVSDGKDFPTCSLTKIANAKSDTVCPKGAMVASGAITALIGPVSDPKAAGGTCNPNLHVWNSGQGKVTLFFVDTAPNHVCLNGAISTGKVGPYPGTVKTQGKNLVIDTPIPNYVSFPLGGVEGSLLTEHLTWARLTKKVHGKTVAYFAAVGCKHGKRPYSTAFTAQFNGASETEMIPGSARCK